LTAGGPGGEGRIRTSEGIANRFTVCPLWPLGNLSDSKSSFADWTNPSCLRKRMENQRLTKVEKGLKGLEFYIFNKKFFLCQENILVSKVPNRQILINFLPSLSIQLTKVLIAGFGRFSFKKRKATFKLRRNLLHIFEEYLSGIGRGKSASPPLDQL
jgi:hypothetical protein